MKSNKDAKIFVAGYKGMVGSAITKVLKARGYNNLLLLDHQDADFRRQADVEALFEKERPEYVILAAAKVGGIIANNTYKAEFIRDNMQIALNVIDSAYKYGVKKLLNLGSSCIYPKHAEQPMTEEALLTGELEPTNEPYAIAKISAIKLCRYYNEQFGTDFISVMPTNLYGNNDNHNLETSHVLPALIRKNILAKALFDNDFDYIRQDLAAYKLGFRLDEKIEMQDNDSISAALAEVGITADSVTIWGSGKVLREFLHVEDMAEACVFLTENFSYDQIGEFVNLGTGIDISIKDLALTIQEIVGFKGEIVFDATKPDGTPRKLLDVSRINNLGWAAEITLREGVKKVITEYFKKVGK